MFLLTVFSLCEKQECGEEEGEKPEEEEAAGHGGVGHYVRVAEGAGEGDLRGKFSDMCFPLKKFMF